MLRLCYRPCLQSSVHKYIEKSSIEEIVAQYEFLCIRDRCNFEVIIAQSKCRYYFDVDYKGDQYTAEQVKQLCCEQLEQSHLNVIFIGSSHRESPSLISYHFNCSQVGTVEEIKSAATECNRRSLVPLFDENVYHANQCMRSVYCVKEKEPNRPFKLEFGSFANSLITVFPAPMEVSRVVVVSEGKSIVWFRDKLQDRALSELWKEKAINYDSWVMVLLFLIHQLREDSITLESALELFLVFSRFSPQFNEVDCRKKFRDNLNTRSTRSSLPSIEKWVRTFSSKPTGPESASTLLKEVSFHHRSQPLKSGIWPITHQQGRVVFFLETFEVEEFLTSEEDLKAISSLLKYSTYKKFEDDVVAISFKAREEGGNIDMPYDEIDDIQDRSILILETFASICIPDVAVDRQVFRSWLGDAENKEQLKECNLSLSTYVLESDVGAPMLFLGTEEDSTGKERLEELLGVLGVHERRYEFQYPYLSRFLHFPEMNAFYFSRACSLHCKAEPWFRLLTNAKDDNAAANIVLKLYPFWLITDGMLYVFDDTTGMWSSDKNTQTRIICRFGNLLKQHGKKHDNNYAFFNSKLMAILKRLEAIADHDTTKFDTLKNSSIGKLLFADGIWYGTEDRFERALIPQEGDEAQALFDPEWNDIPMFSNTTLYFFARIKDDFPIDVDRAVYDDVLQTMFYNMHGQEAGDYHMESLATALMGEKYKGFYVLVGEPNSGKSTEKAMLEAVFGGYCGTGNIEEFAHIKDDKRDGSLKNSMVVNNWFRRLLLFSESSENIVSSESLKQHSSGGEDKMLCRVRYQESSLYDIHYIMFFYVNSMFKVTNPNDPAFIERAKILPWEKSFVETIVDPSCQMKKREEVWFWKNDPVYRKAYCYILLAAYTRFQRRGCRLPTPAIVQTATEFQVGHVESSQEFFEQLMHYCILDGRESSILAREDLQVICDHIGMEPKKLGMKLSSVLNKLRIPERTIQPFVKKWKGKPERWWKGMRLRTASNYAPGFIPPEMKNMAEVLTDFEQWRELMEDYKGVISVETEQNLGRGSYLYSCGRELSGEEQEFVEQWGPREQVVRKLRRVA